MQASKLEAKNKLTHIANQNCALPSSREEAQNRPPLWGSMLRSVFLLRLTNGEEDGLEDVDVRLKRHNMALTEAACNDGTSYNNKIQIGEDKEMNGKWNKCKIN